MSERRPFDGGPLADLEERQVVFATLDSYRQYRRNSHYNVTHRRRQNLYALPEPQWKVLAAPPFNLLDNLNAVDDALDHNADIADAILELGLTAFGLPAEPEKGSIQDWHGAAKPSDMAKAHSTIRQFYRDWSFEGFSSEVEPLVKTVLKDLTDVALIPGLDSKNPSLLLPGAGLARVLFSLSLEGYKVEGNEISYHTLLASNFILNTTQQAQQYKLFPFASTFTNHKKRVNQLMEVSIPDVHPATATAQRKSSTNSHGAFAGEMNMTAGDFLTSYGDPGSRNSFDGVVTIYFIDTAPNLIRYVQTVRNCLKDGGIWINIGPLLWHFDDRTIESERENGREKGADVQNNARTKVSAPQTGDFLDSNLGIGDPGSFELTDEEVLMLLRSMGFEVLKHDYVPTDCGGYIQDPESLIQNRYQCSHWVARKLPNPDVLN